MTMAGLAFSNLARRAARTLLTVLGIALAVGTAVALLALARGVAESVGRGLDETGAEFVVAPKNATGVLSSRLPESVGVAIAAMDGVESVSGELYAFTVAADNESILVAGWSRDSAGWKGAPLLSGRLPDPDRREIMVGDALAEGLGLAAGGEIDLFDETFEIVGVTGYATAMNRGMVVMPLAALQEAALREGQVSFFTVRLKPELDDAARDELRAAIARDLPVIVSDTQEVLDRDMNYEILQAISSAVSLVALVSGAVSLLATLLISVQERTREIGMMAAVGWSDGRIVALIVMEGVLIGSAGCVLGVVLGVAASALFDALPAIGGFISFTPKAADMVLPLLFALPLCAAGAAYPAWRAVRLMPADALRRA